MTIAYDLQNDIEPIITSILRGLRKALTEEQFQCVREELDYCESASRKMGKTATVDRVKRIKEIMDL